MEGIFRDLLRGVRAEEAPDPKEARIRPAYKGETADEVPIQTAIPQSHPLENIDTIPVDEVTKAELAESILALEGAYRLDQASTSPHPPIDNPTLSHPWGPFPTQPDNDLPVNISPIHLQNITTIPGPSTTHLLSTFKRYHKFSKTCGWKLLTLLSLSHTFRNAASEFTKAQWSLLFKMITENNSSFDLVIKTARPKYGAVLITMFQRLQVTESIADSPSEAWMAAINWTYSFASATRQPPEVEDLEDPMAMRYLNHPHRWFVTVNKSSIMPVTPVYTPIEHSVLCSEDFQVENDPRCIGVDQKNTDELVDSGGVVCDICKAKGAMECDVIFKNFFHEPLVEVVETSGKGLGVRSLQAIPKGTVLGEYAGLIRVDATKGDVYVLNGHLGYTDENFYLTTSLHQGNFTRFVNHSCSANCFLTARSFRGKKISVLMAIKEIEIFEEITADYGEDYFLKRGMKCKCSAQGCKIG